MDTNRLKYLVAIVETGSLTKASAILGVSHSGLSKAVSALESETKIELFRPQGRGLEVTEEGKWFYRKALEILKITDEIARGKKTERRAIRLGLSGVLAMTCAGPLSAEFEEPIVFYESDVGETEGRIVSDEIDFGVAFIPSPKLELEYLELGEVQFSPFVREELLKKYATKDIPFIVPISDFPSNPSGYKNRDAWPRHVPRRPHFFASNFAIALDLLRAGGGAVYMPDFVARQENAHAPGTKIVRIQDLSDAQSKRKVFLVKRQSMKETKDMKRVSRLIRRICCSKSNG